MPRQPTKGHGDVGGLAKPPTKPVIVKKNKTNKKYQMPLKMPLGTILTDMSKQQWMVGPSIGSGGFGDIYSARKYEQNKKSQDNTYVIKIEPHDNGPLFVEMHFYMRNAKLEDIEAFKKTKGLKSLGMPLFIGNGSYELKDIKHRFIIMPRFGKDIWSIYLENNRKLPLHTIYRITIQIIDILEYIHGRSYVHADIKGTNILLNYEKNYTQVYLVDFGLASHYTTKDFKPDPKKMHNGTIEYTSRDAHKGVPTRRGDLEILGYNLLEWNGFNLPWDEQKLLTDPKKVQTLKEAFMENIDTSIKKHFSSNCPDPIVNFLKYVAKMNYSDEPDYNKLRKLFESGLIKLGKSTVGTLDFNVNATTSALKKTIRSPSKSIHIDSIDAISSTPKKNTARHKRSSSESSPEIISRKNRKRSPDTKITSSTVNDKKKTSDKGIVVNNELVSKGKRTNKTYQFNFELDVSLDANVIVNVQRKKKNSSADTPSNSGTRKRRSASADDNTISDNDTPVAKIRVSKNKRK